MLPRTSSRIFFTVSPFWKPDKNTSENVKAATPKQRRRGVFTFPMMLPTSCRDRKTQLKFQDSEDLTWRPAGGTFPCIRSLMVSVTLSPPSDWTLMGSISGLVMRMGGVVSATEWRWSQLTGDLPIPDGSALEKQAPGLPLQAGSSIAPISSAHCVFATRPCHLLTLTYFSQQNPSSPSGKPVCTSSMG